MGTRKQRLVTILKDHRLEVKSKWKNRSLKRMTNKLVPCPFRESTQKNIGMCVEKRFVKNPFTGLKNLNEEFL